MKNAFNDEEAEDLVRDLEEKVLQPGVVSDPAVLADVCSVLKHAHDEVDRLYSRGQMRNFRLCDLLPIRFSRNEDMGIFEKSPILPLNFMD